MIKKILLIEDDEEMCEEISVILKDTGYDITYTNDGIKGYDLINNNFYNLLILDLKIPGMSGFDLLSNIKKKNSKMKVLIITARPNMKTDLLKKQNINMRNILKEEKILKRADKIMKKPFKIQDLLNTIKILIS